MTLSQRLARGLQGCLIGSGMLGALLAATPARALEEVLIEIPLLETPFRVRLDELASPEALRRGSSDLAELDRATEIGRAHV